LVEVVDFMASTFGVVYNSEDMSRPRSVGFFAIVVLIVLGVAGAAHAEDSLTAARDLYAAAAYEDSLAMLDRLQTQTDVPDESRTIALYRAFCLFALGRTPEAEKSIETVVAMSPSYQPTDADTSPRMLAAFSDVRRRALPGIIQQKYALAKAAYDRKEFAASAEGFAVVVNLLEDPDVRTVAALSDLRLVASAFRDLSATAAAPPPPVSPPPTPSASRSQPAAPAPKTPAAAEPAAPRAPVGPRIYGAEDKNVVPPAIARQTIPPFRYKPTAAGGHITVSVLINERGVVEGVNMIVLLDPEFDRLVQDFAWKWTYKPATVDGVPVKYRKVVQINLPR
jgi:hypothetical protein